MKTRGSGGRPGNRLRARLSRLLSVLMLTAVAVGMGRSAPRGQAPAPPMFSARSELVVLHVMVKDRKDSYVTGLDSNAFTVFEDGQPQSIRYFGAQDEPATVGLLVDSSGSMLPSRDRVIGAAGAFVETSNPEDEIFAIAFNESVRAALPPEAPFTGDAGTLRRALFGAIAARGRTALYDAVLAGLDYVARGSRPMKALVVVSDGGDNASRASFDEVVRATETANTVIYTIAIIDPLERDANPKRLRQIAEASGGEAFTPRDLTELEEDLRHIARDIRHTYTIGYVPADMTHDGRFRRIRVIVQGPDGRRLRVQTRHGYVLEDRGP